LGSLEVVLVVVVSLSVSTFSLVEPVFCDSPTTNGDFARTTACFSQIFRKSG